LAPDQRLVDQVGRSRPADQRFRPAAYVVRQSIDRAQFTGAESDPGSNGNVRAGPLDLFVYGQVCEYDLLPAFTMGLGTCGAAFKSTDPL